MKAMPLSSKSSVSSKRSQRPPMLPQISVELLDNPSEMYSLGYTYQDIINFRRNFNLSKVFLRWT